MTAQPPTETQALAQLRSAMQAYAPIPDSSWQHLVAMAKVLGLPKGAALYPAGQLPTSFGFVVSGLVRSFVTDAEGREYNKNFFAEGSFPGSMAALLTQSPSRFTLETLEPTTLVLIDFKAYRLQLMRDEALKIFHIHYLERNWLLAKDAREVELVQEDARSRYLRFVTDHPALHQRLPQYHIAAHLGITPTQLSRIRKALAM